MTKQQSRKKRDRSRLRQAEIDITMVGDRVSEFAGRFTMLEQATVEAAKLATDAMKQHGRVNRFMIGLDRRMEQLEGKVDLPGTTVIQEKVEHTPTAIYNLLSMVSIDYIPLGQIKLWDEEQLAWAAAWAMQQHYMASDNEFYDWEMVPRPPHIDKSMYDGSDALEYVSPEEHADNEALDRADYFDT